MIPSPATPISVSALNRLLREHVETGFALLWVTGEISNLSYAASGHVYFSLKDASAQMRCVLWRNRAQLLGWRLANGDRVEVRALPTLFEARGELQLNVENVRRAGQGDLFQQFLQLKAKLANEGLFDSTRKRALPAFPERIALVTSPQAAALRDVLSTFRRRAPHIRLSLFPTLVQGENAGAAIAAALADAGRSGADLILLCRGGGSLEDLWAFNEEVVARAIAASPLPVVCGIGHETDFTIADFVADLRAPTPTAAAEQASPDAAALEQRLADLCRQLRRQWQRQLDGAGQRLDSAAARLVHPATRLQRQREDLALLADRLRRTQSHRTERLRQKLLLANQRLLSARPQTGRQQEHLAAAGERLARGAAQTGSARAHRLETLAAALRQLDPEAVLARGYAIARDPGGNIVRDAAQLFIGEALQLTFGRGQARATVSATGADPQEHR